MNASKEEKERKIRGGGGWKFDKPEYKNYFFLLYDGTREVRVEYVGTQQLKIFI